jgi:hypothetical protein
MQLPFQAARQQSCPVNDSNVGKAELLTGIGMS